MASLSVAQFITLVDKIAATYNSFWGDGLTLGCGDATLPLTDTSESGTITVSANNLGFINPSVMPSLKPGQPLKYVVAGTSYCYRVQMLGAMNGLIVAVQPVGGSPGSAEVATMNAFSLAQDWGASRKVRDLQGLVTGLGDYTSEQFLNFAVNSLQSTCPTSAVMQNFGAALQGLDNSCLAVGQTLALRNIMSLNSFATYYNTGAGGPYSCLLSPDFAILYNLVRGSWPTATNVYAPANVSLAVQAYGGSFFSNSVDTTRYAGYVTLNLNTLGQTGTGNITVAVSGYDVSGNAQTDSWVLTNVGNNANVALTAYSLTTVKVITAVNSISFNVGSGNISAGTATVVGNIPSGRVNPCV
jgi:hypothetical protein